MHLGVPSWAGLFLTLVVARYLSSTSGDDEVLLWAGLTLALGFCGFYGYLRSLSDRSSKTRTIVFALFVCSLAYASILAVDDSVGNNAALLAIFIASDPFFAATIQPFVAITVFSLGCWLLVVTETDDKLFAALAAAGFPLAMWVFRRNAERQTVAGEAEFVEEPKPEAGVDFGGTVEELTHKFGGETGRSTVG